MSKMRSGAGKVCFNLNKSFRRVVPLRRVLDEHIFRSLFYGGADVDLYRMLFNSEHFEHSNKRKCSYPFYKRHPMACILTIVDRYEAQIAQLEQQSWNMESTQLTTDNLRNTMATVDAMKTANKELKRQYGKVDVDKIEQMHYDMEDLLEQANEIQETMARSYAVPDEIDEDELQAGKY
jgi:hypothetical protein